MTQGALIVIRGNSTVAGDGLGASASRGAAATLIGQIVRITVQLAGVVVMARLLDPSDYGLLAMVTAIIGVGEIFRDFGLSSAAIQAKTLSRAQKNNLFWINTGIGALLTAIVAALSGMIAALYDDPRLQLLSVVLASTFLLNGISTQFRAELNRNLQFIRLSTAEVVSQTLGLAVGITMAVLGFEYWSLAGLQVSQIVFQIIALVIASRWFPGGISRTAPMGGFLRFGSSLFGAQLLAYASRNVDSIVIGGRFGPESLGLYNRAFQLMLLPLHQINAPSTRVALPILSKLQDQPARFAAFVSFGQVIMLNVVSLILAFCGAQAFAIISVALGQQWLASVPIFQVLLIAGFFQTANYVVYWVFLSRGLTRSNLMFSLATRPAMVVLILVGSNWGVHGVAWAYAISVALMWPLGVWWLARTVSFSPAVLFGNGLRTLCVFSLAAAASYLSTMAIPTDALALRLVVGFLALIAVVACAAVVWPRYRKDVLSILGARQYFRRAKSRVEPETDDSTESSEEDDR
ncbi:MAG: lipopolysaccharide biosynthesis protein [Rhodoglobus sp.]